MGGGSEYSLFVSKTDKIIADTRVEDLITKSVSSVSLLWVCVTQSTYVSTSL